MSDDKGDLAYQTRQGNSPAICFTTTHRAGIFQINSRQDQHANLLQMRQLVSQSSARRRPVTALWAAPAPAVLRKYGAANSAKPITDVEERTAQGRHRKRYLPCIEKDRPTSRAGISKI